MLYKKQKKYEINIDRANDILQNVFAAESKTPNTIPFDKLVLRAKPDTRRYDIPLCLAVLLLILTLISPFCIVPIAEKLDPAFQAVDTLDDFPDSSS